MLKEFIEHIQKTTSPQIVQVGGQTFAVDNSGVADRILPDFYGPDTLCLTSLDALVKLVQTEAVPYAGDGAVLYITVPGHLSAVCFGRYDPEDAFSRTTYYEADAVDVPGWDDKVTLPFEEAQIALRTRFQPSADLDYVMKLLSDISTGAKITFNDNGIATSIVTRKGIDLQGADLIKPIVSLRPYRTFQEVEQPESVFLIRVNERGISFIEADGGMWKLKARQTVKEYLEKRLEKEIDAGCVVVAL